MWSVEASPEMSTHAPQSCESTVYLATLVQRSTLEATGVAAKKAVDNLQLSAVTVGGESGVPVQMHCQSSVRDQPWRGPRGDREGLVLGSEGSLLQQRTFMTTHGEVSAELEKVLS